ncbi:chaplin [Kitasatospora acidiphila]|uniref:chaplin n=1 Tax=Kitasatospora acidiphila TaxID=2567942 RepID=UPI003C717E9C
MNAKKIAVLSTAAVGIVLGSAGSALASAGAEGVAAHSPGVLSGNAIQVPVHIPINICGDSVNVVGLLNPAFGNTCINNDTHVDNDTRHHHGDDDDC